MRSKNYVIYDKPYQLNIVGVRNAQSQPNKFDDNIFVFFKDDKNDWVVYEYPATTDAGTFFLLNPMSNLGTAMLKEGQYVNAYAQGYHKGLYLALVQVKAVTTYRDYDRNALFDIFTKETTGSNYGINEFTYTLIDERAIMRRKRRIVLFISLGVSLIGGGLLLYKKFKR